MRKIVTGLDDQGHLYVLEVGDLESRPVGSGPHFDARAIVVGASTTETGSD